MPQYVIPPWIHGADTASQYGRGYALGQQGAESAARLQLASMQLAAEQARHERDFTYRQQEAEIQRQMDEQRMSLQKQEFDERMRESQQKLALEKQRFAEDQKMDAIRGQQAAAKFAAMQTYQKLVETGMDPDKAALQVGPTLFQSPAGYAALAREVYAKGKPGFEPTVKDVGGVKMAQLTPNRWTIAKGQGMSPETKAKIEDSTRDIRQIGKELQAAQADPSKKQADIIPIQERLYNAQAKRHQLFQKEGQPGPSAAPGQPPTTPDQPKVIDIIRDASGKFVPKAGPSQAGSALTAPTNPTPSLGTPAPAAPAPQAASGIGAMAGGLAGMTLAQGQGQPGLASAAKPPQAPDAPDYIKSYRDELKKAGGNLSKGAKDYLSDMISGLSDEALNAAAQKHGLDVSGEGQERQDLEQDLVGTVEDQGWQLPWPE